ncbi:MAG: peptidoglycan DD-metalloendopeptidase family protein [Chitinophagaceae bacterium]|nr:peptidoglycan DD-metalloendopeptidase family protein [Chitinophagaceae bacterium]
MKYIKIILVFLLFFFFFESIAQKSKTFLEKEKQKTKQKIDETKSVIIKTENEKESTLSYLKEINAKVEKKETVLKSMREEMKILQADIEELSFIITSLESDMAILKKEYAELIYNTQKQTRSLSILSFLFTSQNFYQLFLRLQYHNQYAKLRSIQAREIAKISQSLETEKKIIEKKQFQKEQVVKNIITENNTLTSLKKTKDALVIQLSNRQKELEAELVLYMEAVKKIDELIAKTINNNEKKNNTIDTKINPKSIIEEEYKRGIAFESKKNKLIWPVKSGFVSSKFGRQPHPILKRIEIENQGIDIQTKEKKARAIHDGIVSTVAFVPVMQNVVIIKHGEYYTLYAKLSEIHVKKGDKIKTGQIIGDIFVDTNKIAEIQFQIWKNNQKLNPENWIMMQK